MSKLVIVAVYQLHPLGATSWGEKNGFGGGADSVGHTFRGFKLQLQW